MFSSEIERVNVGFGGRIRAWLSAKLHGHTLIKHMLTLLSGTAAAQLVALLASLVTARLFTPEAFGQFAVYGSITGVAITLASLRFEMTIVLPSDDDSARVLAKLATRSNIVVALLASALAVVFQDVVTDVWGSEELSQWLVASGLTIFLVAQVTVLQYWYTRQTQYGVIAANRVQQTVGSAGGQVAFGLAGVRSLPGLLLGTLAGQAFAYLNLQRKATALRKPVAEGTPSMRSLAWRHRRMPLLNLPTALVDSIRLNGITMLIGLIALGSVGQFNLAWRVLQVPVALIAGSVAQLFYQHLARTRHGDMSKLVSATVRRLALLAVLPFGAIYVIAPWLFLFAFGDQWDQAGDFARALSPWLFMQVITSPISTIFVVADKQHWQLMFAVAYAALPLSLLAFSPWSILITVTALGWMMAGLLALNLLLARAAARSFDRRGGVE